MAKRKTRAARRKAAGSRRSRSTARKAVRRGARKTRKTAKKTARKASARTRAKATGARKTAARRRSAAAGRRKTTARKPTPRRRTSTRTLVTRRAPALDRPRRTVEEEDMVPMPPSSLDLDRHGSAARTGRREMRERTEHLTQTGPAMTGGDVDADWESAYSVGDEAPGGDNPTPDQDIVDDIGRAVGVEYEDNEELKGEEKISRRDRRRWELDPASSEDYNNRD